MRRFGCALGLSLAIHSIALVAASTVGSIAPATVRRIPEPLFLILGAGGPNTGAGGLPSDFRGSAAALPETPPAPSDPGSERVVEPPSRRGSVPPSLPAARRDRIAPTRAAEVVGSRAATTTPTTRAIGGPTVSESGLLASGGPAPSGASGSGSGGGTGARAIAYEQTLAAWLNSHKYYPASLRRRGIEGEGKLQIRIARSGHVLAVDVAAAFPHPSLEAISQDWVKRAQPFPPVPDTIPGESYVFIVPVGFRLQ